MDGNIWHPQPFGFMEILHFYLRLNQTDNNYVELRFFENNPNVYQKLSFALSEVSDLI